MDLSRLDFSLFRKSEGAPKVPSVVSAQVERSAQSVARAKESSSSNQAKNNLRERRKHQSQRYTSSSLNTLGLDLGNLSAQLADLQDSIERTSLNEAAVNATKSAVLLTKSMESTIDARGITKTEKIGIKQKLIEVSRSLDLVRNNLRSKNDLFFEKKDSLESAAACVIRQSQDEIASLKENIAKKIVTLKGALENPPDLSEANSRAVEPEIAKCPDLDLSLKRSRMVATFIVTEGPKVMSTQLMPDTEKLIDILTAIEIGIGVTSSFSEHEYTVASSRSDDVERLAKTYGQIAKQETNIGSNPFVASG